jgi:light-regulated signal transduction histidine kinase (bacteriophytochrome)
VDGFARILEEDYAAKLDDEGRRLLGTVRDNAARMGKLIDDLLELSRTGRRALSTGQVDMAALVRKVMGELRPEYPGANIEIGDLPQTPGDESLLRQVWVNLISNAFKYSAKVSGPMIQIGGRSNGNGVEYWVRDNGAGFDMTYYDKLFGVFQRLHGHDEFPGTGVGLAIVQRVLVRHGGRVWADGRVGGGAIFHFSLPH